MKILAKEIAEYVKRDKLRKYDFWKLYVGGRTSDKEFKDSVDQNYNRLLKDGFSKEQIGAIKSIQNPQIDNTRLSSEEIILFLRQLDEAVCQNYFGRLEVVLIGGTEISFFSKHRVSRDLDMIIPAIKIRSFAPPLLRNRFKKRKMLNLLSVVPLIYLIDVDLFLSCKLPSVNIKDYLKYCVGVRELNSLHPKTHINLPNLRRLKVMFLHPVDLICAKIFANRQRDRNDCKTVIKIFPKITLGEVLERLAQMDKKRGNYKYYIDIAKALFQ